MKNNLQKLGIIFLFYGSTMGETLFDEAGTAILVLTQMLVSCLGIITNSLLLVAVKDFSSTYHILLANLSFCNLFVCTILKPVLMLMLILPQLFTLNLVKLISLLEVE